MVSKMKQISFPVIGILLSLVCLLPAETYSESADGSTTSTVSYSFPELYTAPVVGKEEIEKAVKGHQSDLLIINLWATWCAPCVEELPYFIEEANRYPSERVRFFGISADFHDKVDDLVIPFLKEKEIPYPNVVYYGPHQVLIEYFSDKWEGDLPATFFYDRSGKQIAAFPGQLSHDELKAAIRKHLPQ